MAAKQTRNYDELDYDDAEKAGVLRKMPMGAGDTKGFHSTKCLAAGICSGAHGTPRSNLQHRKS